ncbi:capsule biosynthesis protein CapA-like [Clytia hemisphaerica]|uniref:Capsule synthesis protein CapA domain-containing protein n=1 Tax=Clytia hemisphaerica TaxID=252671 RepID=A0A7M5X3P5_9CNID
MWCCLIFPWTFLLCFDYVLSKSKSLELIFGGDVTFYGPIDYHFQNGDCSYERPFQNVKEVFAEGDFTMVNLETTLGNIEELKDNTTVKKLIRFTSDPQALESLRKAGVSTVTVANNHLLDFGERGVNNTLNEIRKYGIKPSGYSIGKNIYEYQEPIIFEKNGIRVCVLSYCNNREGCKRLRKGKTTGPAIFNTRRAMKEIDYVRKKLKPNALIVYLHQGKEYAIVSGKQEGLKEKFEEIATQADVVVESHTHVTSGHFYHNKTLFTGQLGNLLFPLHHPTVRRFNPMSDDGKNISDSTLKKIDDSWYMAQKNFKNPSARSKLVKLHFGKNGLVSRKTKYMYTCNEVDSNRCLYVKPSSKKWTVICSREDKDCEGVTNCNFIDCQ